MESARPSDLPKYISHLFQSGGILDSAPVLGLRTLTFDELENEPRPMRYLSEIPVRIA